MRQYRNDDGGRGNRGRNDGGRCGDGHRFRQHRRRGSRRCSRPWRHEDGAGRLLHHGNGVGDCLRCLRVRQRGAQHCRILAGLGPLIGGRPDGDNDRGQQRQHTDDENCHECATNEHERFGVGLSRLHRVVIGRIVIGRVVSGRVVIGHGAIPQRGHIAGGRSLGDDPGDCGNVGARSHTHGLGLESRGVRCRQCRAACQSQRTVLGRVHGEGGSGGDLRLQRGDVDTRADHEHRLRRLSQPLEASHHVL